MFLKAFTVKLACVVVSLLFLAFNPSHVADFANRLFDGLCSR